MCGAAAQSLASDFGKQDVEKELTAIDGALSKLTTRTEPHEAVRILLAAIDGSALSDSRSLIWSDGEESTLGPGGTLALALSDVSNRLARGEAERVCAPAARKLAEILVQETGPETRLSLARAVLALSARLIRSDAAAICGPATRVLTEALGRARSWHDVLR
jgi:hypothetical protein